MKSKQIFAFFGLASLGAMILSSCQSEKPGTEATAGAPSGAKKRIAFVTNGIADFWTIAEAGAKAAGEKLGVDAQVLMPAQGLPEQKQILEDLVTKGFDGIAVSPIDPRNQTELLDRTAESTVLITHDSDAPQSKRRVYVGMDNYTAGRMCGQLVKEALPSGGSIMLFVGRMEQDNARARRQGVIDELMDRPADPARFDAPGNKIEGSKFVILDTLTDNFDQDKAKTNAEDALARYPDLAAMVGLFAYNTPAILQALERGNKLTEVKVISFDEDAQTLLGIQKGTVYGTVVQNPYMYGYKSIEILNAILGGDTSMIPESKFINIEGRLIRKDNVDEFWADLKSKLGQ